MKKTAISTKSLAFIMAILMVFSLMPTASLADGPDDYEVSFACSNVNANKGDTIYVDLVVSSESESYFEYFQTEVLFDNNKLSFNTNVSSYDSLEGNVIGNTIILAGFGLNETLNSSGSVVIATLAFDVIAASNDSVEFTFHPDPYKTVVGIGSVKDYSVSVSQEPLKVDLHSITVRFEAGIGASFLNAPVTAYAKYGQAGLFDSDAYVSAFIIPTVTAELGYALAVPVWSDGVNNYSAETIASMSFTQSTVFTARAIKLNAVRFFDMDGAQIGDTQYVADGEYAIAPVADEISNMDFNGWFVVANESQGYAGEALYTKAEIDVLAVTADVIYKAYYTWNTFTITGDLEKLTFTAGVDTSESPYMVTYGVDIEFDVEAAPTGYRYDVYYSVGGEVRSLLEAEENGSYVISGDKILGNIVIYLQSVVDARIRFIKFEEYIGAPTGFKVAIVTPEFVLESAWTIAYDNGGATADELFWSSYYKGYVWFVDSDLSINDVLANLCYVSGVSVSIAYDGDVNRNGRVNVQDAQIVHDLYSNRLLDGFSVFGMLERFEADVNGDGVVDSMDAQAIMYIILNP
ncbi:MAG: dockerin type I domain-containing protein [Oscillospiraceae bacterium]|nr:dockerin type I domain-containing protein [Oscillospiraceae bacterium]